MKSNSQYTDPSRKTGTVGNSIWVPLPSSMLDIIFDPSVSSLILGNLISGQGDVGEWDTKNGIYKHHSSGIYLVIAADPEDLVYLRKYINLGGSPASIKSKMNDTAPQQLNKKLQQLADVFGKYIALIQPYEYTPYNHRQLLERHFSTSPGWAFVREGISDYPGTIRVKSMPTHRAIEDIPGSHSSQIPRSLSRARSNPVSNRFKHELDILDVLFEDTTKETDFVSDVLPDNPGQPLERNLENHQGRITFIDDGANKQAPIAAIGQDAFINNAGFIQDGSIQKVTLEGPYRRNINPAHPSSHFYPHADWLSALFVFPQSLIRDPKTAAAIIGIALIISKGQEHTKYISTLNKTKQVIDNQQIEDDLLGA